MSDSEDILLTSLNRTPAVLFGEQPCGSRNAYSEYGSPNHPLSGHGPTDLTLGQTKY